MRHVMISRKKKGRDEREFILVEVSFNSERQGGSIPPHPTR